MHDINQIIQNSLSTYDTYCEGYNGNGGNYLLAINLATSAVKKQFSHAGSQLLDEINAFDAAEVKNAFIGQLNMMTVSSFCGPMGAILGYDFLRTQPDFTVEFTIEHTGKKINVFSIHNLITSSVGLFGTIHKKIFPIIPGSHTFCATKNIKKPGPTRIYAAIGVGIAKNREQNANLMMEDVGTIPLTADLEKYKKALLKNLAKSILQVGINQRVEYKEIFVGIEDQYINEDEIGCALVASPYFKIAKKALAFYEQKFSSISLKDWQQHISHY